VTSTRGHQQLEGDPMTRQNRLSRPTSFAASTRVTRASTAGAGLLMAMATTRQVAEVLRRAGRFDTLAPAIAQTGAQRRFADVG